MRSALSNEKFTGVAIGGIVGSRELVYKPMLVVYAAAPVAVHVLKRLGLSNAGVTVPFNLKKAVEIFL